MTEGFDAELYPPISPRFNCEWNPADVTARRRSRHTEILHRHASDNATGTEPLLQACLRPDGLRIQTPNQWRHCDQEDPFRR